MNCNATVRTHNNGTTSSSSSSSVLLVAPDLELHKNKQSHDGDTGEADLKRNIQRWNSCNLMLKPDNGASASPKQSQHRRKVLGRPASPTVPFTPKSPHSNNNKQKAELSPPRICAHSPTTDDEAAASVFTPAPTTTTQRESPRRFKSDGWLDLPSFDDGNNRGGLILRPDDSPHKRNQSPVRTSPRRMLSLEVDVRKRLVRSGQSVRTIEPEPQDFRTALAKTGQSVRRIRTHTNLKPPLKEEDNEIDSQDDDESDQSEEQEQGEESMPAMSASFSALEGLKDETKEDKVTPPLRMASSMSNIPFLEPLVEEDSERNESEEFHLLAVQNTLTKNRPSSPLIQEPINEEEEGSVDARTMASSTSNLPYLEPLVEEDTERNESEEFHLLAVQTQPVGSPSLMQAPTQEEEEESVGVRTTSTRESGGGSDAFAKRPPSPKPTVSVSNSVAATANVGTSGRQSKMSLMSRLSMRFSRKGPVNQRSNRKSLGMKALSCRNPVSQVATECYGPPVLIPATTTSSFETMEAASSQKQPKEISLPASPVRAAITLKQVPPSVLTPPPKTTRSAQMLPLKSPSVSAMTTRSPHMSSPKCSSALTPPPATTRPMTAVLTSNDPKDVVFSPPPRMRSFSNASSARRSPIASDSGSVSPPTSPMKSIARSPSRSSPRRRMSRSFLSRHSIRSVISQRSITTNNAVSEGIYPQKGGVVPDKSPRRRLVARLSFRLSQSDLNHTTSDENGFPIALRNVPDPSNLQEKQEERRNLLSRMARQDADSRTAEMSITHTRQASFADDDREEVEEDYDDERDDDMRFVPETVSFFPDAGDEESAITDACTWAESSLASLDSRNHKNEDIKLPPRVIQGEDDNVSCLRSGSFRLADRMDHITRSASGKSLLTSPLGDADLSDGNDDDDDDDKDPSVSLFHVSPSRKESRQYPKMQSLRAKTLQNLELSDGSLYLDDPTTPKPKDEKKNIPGDTMDEDFYLAEIVKALEEQNRKTKQILQRKAKSKPSSKYLVEL